MVHQKPGEWRFSEGRFAFANQTLPARQRHRKPVTAVQSVLITGTDTNVGKTWVTALLLRTAVAAGMRYGGYKPVCSGAIMDTAGLPVWEDVEELMAATGGRFDAATVCPQRFLAPVAPPEAAAQEHKRVNPQLLREGATAFRDHCDVLLVEGAGGLLCPLSDTTTVLDLAVELQSALIVVSANRLGVLNHTLLTVEVARARGLTVAAVILNDIRAAGANDADQSITSNGELLQRWLPSIPLLHCGFKAQKLTQLSSHPVPPWIVPAVREAPRSAG
jgi:dethiobiotin synthetase